LKGRKKEEEKEEEEEMVARNWKECKIKTIKRNTI